MELPGVRVVDDVEIEFQILTLQQVQELRTSHERSWQPREATSPRDGPTGTADPARSRTRALSDRRCPRPLASTPSGIDFCWACSAAPASLPAASSSRPCSI